MMMTMKEKKMMYLFACSDYRNTVTRLKWVSSLTVDPKAARRMFELARKMETEVDESWYSSFFYNFRMEMEEYYRLKRSMRAIEDYTEYEEEMYDKADEA